MESINRAGGCSEGYHQKRVRDRLRNKYRARRMAQVEVRAGSEVAALPRLAISVNNYLWHARLELWLAVNPLVDLGQRPTWS
jgi:hypothetical protein